MIAVRILCTIATLVAFASTAGTTTNTPKDLGKTLKQDMGQIIEEFLSKVLIQHPTMTLVIALFLLVEDYLRHFHRRKWIFGKMHGKNNAIMRRLAIDLIILIVYYGSEAVQWVHKRPFVITLALVFFDSFAMYSIGLIISQTCHRPHHPSVHDEHDDDEADPYREEDHDTKKYIATSKYMHISLRLRTVVPVFFAQSAIMIFYMFYLNADEDSHDVHKVAFLYWVVAIILQLYAGEQQLGDPYCPEYWETLLNHTDVEVHIDKKSTRATKEIAFLDKAPGVTSQHSHKTCTYRFNAQDLTIAWEIFGVPVQVPLRWELQLRRLMDLCINRFLREVVVFTFPIMLANEGPLDFVKDCTAVWFITTLDDLDVGQDEQTKIPDMLGKVFKRWAWDHRKYQKTEARETLHRRKVADHTVYERFSV